MSRPLYPTAATTAVFERVRHPANTEFLTFRYDNENVHLNEDGQTRLTLDQAGTTLWAGPSLWLGNLWVRPLLNEDPIPGLFPPVKKFANDIRRSVLPMGVHWQAGALSLTAGTWTLIEDPANGSQAALVART